MDKIAVLFLGMILLAILVSVLCDLDDDWNLVTGNAAPPPAALQQAVAEITLTPLSTLPPPDQPPRNVSDVIAPTATVTSVAAWPATQTLQAIETYTYNQTYLMQTATSVPPTQTATQAAVAPPVDVNATALAQARERASEAATYPTQNSQSLLPMAGAVGLSAVVITTASTALYLVAKRHIPSKDRQSCAVPHCALPASAMYKPSRRRVRTVLYVPPGARVNALPLSSRRLSNNKYPSDAGRKTS